MYYAHEKFLGPFGVMQGHFGSWRVILGHKGTSLKHHFGPWRAILGHKGPLGAVLSHFGAPLGLWKGPRVVQHDIISCIIPMRSVLGPFGVMQGHFGSWPKIWTIPNFLFWDFFGTKIFRDWFRDSFSVPNFSDSGSETFFGTKIFRDRFRDSFSVPNFFDSGSKVFF